MFEASKLYELAIAPTLALKANYEAQGFPVPVRLGRIGVDVDRSTKPPRADPILRLGFVGQIAPHKGLDVLLTAMRMLRGRKLKLKVWGLMREGDAYCEKLRRAAEGLDVSFEGTFQPRATEQILAGVDLLVAPSIWPENGPIIVLQALATHTPVVASDAPGLTEFVRDNENGVVFRSGDAASLAAALARVEEDRGLISRLSERANYPRGEREMAEQLVTCYEEARGMNLSRARRS